MIRFIDLRGQIYTSENDPCFTWFNTVTEVFMEFDGSNHFLSLDEFIQAYNADVLRNESQYPLERFLRLIPDGYFELAV